MFRRILSLLIGFPLGIILVAIAVSNRQPVDLILDPFRPETPALSIEPSPFEPLDDGSKKVIQDMIADGFKWFVGLVETRRGVKAADIPGLLDGRIFSGREALQAKLVDQIGGEDEAVKWLKDVKNVPQNAKVTDWKPEKSGSYGILGMSAGIAGWLFGPSAADATNFLLRDRTISTLGLDGLLSVWHPSEK